MNTKKKFFILNSGGGAQAISAPPNFTAIPLTTTSARLQWIKDGADSYKKYVDDVLEDESSDGTESYFDVTGLTINTEYTFKLVGVHDGVDSEPVEVVCSTIKFMPELWVEPTGAIYNTDNQYGNVTSVSSRFASPLKSIINTSRTISFSSAAPTLTGLNERTVGVNMNVNANTTYALSSDISLDGVFCIHFKGVLLQVANNLGIIGKNADGTYNYIRLSGSGASLQMRTDGGASIKTITLSRTLVVGENVEIRIRRDASNVVYCKINDDSETSVTAVTGTFIFNEPFGWNNSFALNAVIERFVITKQAQDDEYDNQVWNYLKQPDYASAAPVSSLALNGVTWSDLPADGEIVDAALADEGLGGQNYNRLIQFGPNGRYCIVGSSKPADITDKQEDCFFVIDCMLGKYSQRFDLAEILPVDYDDGHNVVSYAEDDNKLLIIYYPEHWEDAPGLKNGIRIMVSGPNFDLTTWTARDHSNLIGSSLGTCGQYPQMTKIGNKRFIKYTSQTGPSFQQDSVSILRATDFWNGFHEKLVAMATGANGKWVYSYLMDSNSTGKLGVIANLDLATPDRFYASALILSDDDGVTWRNAANTLSRNVKSTGPITEAQALANCLLSDDESATSEDVACLSAFFNSDGSAYGLLMNDTGGLEVWTMDTDGVIDRHSVTLDVSAWTKPHGGPDGASAASNGKNNPFVVFDGTTYTVFFHGIHDTNKWDVRYVTSTDLTNWSASVKISQDDTLSYYRMNVPNNVMGSQYGAMACNKSNGNILVHIFKTP